MLVDLFSYFLDHSRRNISRMNSMSRSNKVERVYPGTGIEFQDGSMRCQTPVNVGIDLLPPGGQNRIRAIIFVVPLCLFTECALDCFEVGSGDCGIRHRLNSIVVTGKSEPSIQEYGKPWTQFFSRR